MAGLVGVDPCTDMLALLGVLFSRVRLIHLRAASSHPAIFLLGKYSIIIQTNVLQSNNENLTPVDLEAFRQRPCIILQMVAILPPRFHEAKCLFGRPKGSQRSERHDEVSELLFLFVRSHKPGHADWPDQTAQVNLRR